MPKLSIADLIMAMVGIVVGLVLLPVVNTSVTTAQADYNSSSTMYALIGLIPILYVILIVGAAVAYVAYGLKGQ